MMKTFSKVFCALSFCAAVCVTLPVTSSASATTAVVHVDINNGSASPAGLGDDWGSGHAYLYLQDAIARAAIVLGLPGHPDDVEIWLADGTYYPDEGSGHDDGVRSESFSLGNHVRILGGFSGSGTVRDPETYFSILSGDIDKNSTLDSSNCYHVVTATSGVDDTAIIDGCVIKFGYADGGGSNQNLGGGILLDQGHPKIRGCTITANHATDKGGGIMCLDTATAPEIRNCKIIANKADGVGIHAKGGGLDTNYSVTMLNTLFQDNTADDWGAGFSIEGTGSRQVAIAVINCQFIGNVAEQYGGGIYVDASGSFTILNCLFDSNQGISSTQSNGGAIWTGGAGTIHVTNCTFVNNTVAHGEGGGWANYGTQNRHRDQLPVLR